MGDAPFCSRVPLPPKVDLVEQFLARAETSDRHARRVKAAIGTASHQGHGPLNEKLVADQRGKQDVPALYVGPAPPRPGMKPRSERRRLQQKRTFNASDLMRGSVAAAAPPQEKRRSMKHSRVATDLVGRIASPQAVLEQDLALWRSMWTRMQDMAEAP